jgi:hypothetical protein
LASDLKIASKNIFTKNKGNALTSEEFANFMISIIIKVNIGVVGDFGYFHEKKK